MNANFIAFSERTSRIRRNLFFSCALGIIVTYFPENINDLNIWGFKFVNDDGNRVFLLGIILIIIIYSAVSMMWNMLDEYRSWKHEFYIKTDDAYIGSSPKEIINKSVQFFEQINNTFSLGNEYVKTLEEAHKRGEPDNKPPQYTDFENSTKSIIKHIKDLEELKKEIYSLRFSTKLRVWGWEFGFPIALAFYTSGSIILVFSQHG